MTTPDRAAPALDDDEIFIAVSEQRATADPGDDDSDASEPNPAGGGSDRDNRIFYLVLALVLLPLFATIFSMYANDWVPTGDDAFVARRTTQVMTSMPPKVGQDSTAKAEAGGRLLSHPGPIAYYLSAGPYAATGWAPVGLLLGVGIVVIGAAASSVWLGWRTWGVPGLWATAIALLLVMVRLSPNILIRPTSSLTVILPIFAMLLGLCAFIAGTRAGAIVAVLMANYCLQTSLVVLPIVSVTLLVLAVVAAFDLGRGWRPGRGAAIVAGIVALSWVPPLREEFGPGRGNISGLVHYLLGGNTSAHSSMLGWTKSSEAFSGYIWSSPWSHTIEGTSTRIPVGSLVQFALLAVLLAGLAWWNRRRLVAAPQVVAVAVGAAVIGMYAFSKRPHSLPRNPNYMSGWIQAVAGLFWFLVILLVFALAARLSEVLRPRIDPLWAGWIEASRTRLGVAGLAVLTLPLVFYQPGPSTSLGVAYSSSRIVNVFADAVRAEVDGGDVNVIGSGIRNNQLAKGLGVELRRYGFTPHFRELTPMTDEQRARPVKGAMMLRVADLDDPPERWDKLLAVVLDTSGTKVAVWFAMPTS